MPRRAPSTVRGDLRSRRLAENGGFARTTSRLPGLSPRGRAVLARLECADPRLWPGAAQEAFSYWIDYLRDPYASRWDRPDSCHIWECCPDIDEARDIVRTVLHNLPRPDAHRLRARLVALGDDPD